MPKLLVAGKLKTLYFTSRTHLGSVNVKIPGVPVPVPKKTTG